MADIAPSCVLTVPDGGASIGTMVLTSAAPQKRNSLHISVARGWLDLLLGSTSGAGDISRAAWGSDRRRLLPGEHVLSFTPGVSTIYLQLRRDVEGLSAASEIYFLDPGDLVLSPPYDESELFSIRSAQSRSIRWTWHYNHAPKSLIRYSNDSWGLATWNVDDGPFIEGDLTITVAVSALRGTGKTLTANRDLWDDRHIGALWQLTHAGQDVTKALTAANVFSDYVRISDVGVVRNFSIVIAGTFVANLTLQRSSGDPGNWQDVKTYTAADVGTITFNDKFDNAIIFYRIGIKPGDYTSGTANVELIYGAGETTGIARITDVTDAQHAVVDILSPFGALYATNAWSQGAWSAYQGWPAAGEIYDGRLWLVSVISLFGSDSDNFDSFHIGSNDGDGISRVLSVGDASPIRWVKGAMRLQLGSDAEVADIDAVLIGAPAPVQIRSSALDEPITPANITARKQASKIVFVDASLVGLQRVSYDPDTNSFQTDELSRINRDIGLLHGGFVDLASQMRPIGRLWLPTGDGQLGQCTVAETDAVVGWSRIVHDAAIKSVAIASGVVAGEADQDFLHFIAEREVDGLVRLYHERLERERQWTGSDSSDAWHLACALKYTGPATSYLLGLEHLYGKPVLVWSQGAQLGPFTVQRFDDGTVGVYLGDGVTTTKAVVGLEMISRYVSGKLPYGAQAGSAVGEKKNADHVTTLFFETALGGVSYGMGDGTLLQNDPSGATLFAKTKMVRVSDAFPNLKMDDKTQLYTGELELPVRPGNLRDPRILFKIDGAGPAAILGYVINMETNERL